MTEITDKDLDAQVKNAIIQAADSLTEMNDRLDDIGVHLEAILSALRRMAGKGGVIEP